MSSSETLENILNEGADTAKAMGAPFLKEIKRKMVFFLDTECKLGEFWRFL